MSNSNNSVQIETTREKNTGINVDGKNNAVSVSNAMLQQGEVSALTPPPQSHFSAEVPQEENQEGHQKEQNLHYQQQQQQLKQQQQAYMQQVHNYYPHTLQSGTPKDQQKSPGPAIGYDVQAAFHQQNAAYFERSYGSTALPQLPLTPSSNSKSHVGMGGLGVGSASPNFPAQGPFGGVTMEQMEHNSMNLNTHATPPSPGIGLPRGFVNNSQGVPSASPVLQGYGGVYATYMNPAMGGVDDMHSPLSPQPTWQESSMQQQLYQQALASPQFSGMPYVANNIPPRTQSFEEMLPPSTMSSSDSLEQYTQYQQNIGAAGSGSTASATLFAHPQPWGFSSAEMYTSGVNNTPHSSHIVSGPAPYPASASSPPGRGIHPHQQHQPHQGKGSISSGRGLYHGNQGSHPYYQHTATTPGPPIQTTASNKGPDGANLFIFHIPNHFTNLDMYKLFCTYGNLLSVRIMVEKDTGRSRGFGFVSYDNPESAATAIKELNGFVIGNKRLKVQHKQIKSSDNNNITTNTNAASMTTNASPSDDAPLFYDGHKERESVTRESGKGGILNHDATGNNDNDREAVPIMIKDDEKNSALNHFESMRSSLPETSG